MIVTRRKAIQQVAFLTAATAAVGSVVRKTIGQQAPPPPPAAAAAPAGPFKLDPLPYAADALEPHIDARTMEIHHDKHHAAYVTNLNKAVAGNADLSKQSVEDLVKNLASVPEAIRTAVRNHGGGHANHSFFWRTLKKNNGRGPSAELAKAIDTAFGSFSGFKEQFTKAAMGQFGSGWAWLTCDGKALKIEATANQDSPLSQGRIPVLGIDVWEHAYYLKYQNRRADYVTAFFEVIHWDYVGERYEKALA